MYLHVVPFYNVTHTIIDTKGKSDLTTLTSLPLAWIDQTKDDKDEAHVHYLLYEDEDYICIIYCTRMRITCIIARG